MNWKRKYSKFTTLLRLYYMIEYKMCEYILTFTHIQRYMLIYHKFIRFVSDVYFCPLCFNSHNKNTSNYQTLICYLCSVYVSWIASPNSLIPHYGNMAKWGRGISSLFGMNDTFDKTDLSPLTITTWEKNLMTLSDMKYRCRLCPAQWP